MIDPIKNNPIYRREFLKKSAVLGAGTMVLPSFVAGQSPISKAPNSRINIAIVGVGGKGRGPTINSVSENVVALCDLDMRRVDEARTHAVDGVKFTEALAHHEKKGAKWFSDYRVMFEEMGDKIDAVIISIPDHMHFPVAMSAINLGKHVYCEKPMTHTVEEARILTKAAAKKNIVTQMGNQGHSNNGTRLVKEWLEAGVIGEVKEVHSWTNRPVGSWTAIHGQGKPDHSEGAPPIPEELNWDLWQGIADRREYDPLYLPFSWRGFLDFGCGSLGDMACHIMDSAYWGLNLGSPTNISAETTYRSGYTFPKSSVVSFDFPKRGNLPALTYKWYDGGMLPSLPKFLKDYNAFEGIDGENGTLFIGEDMAIQTTTYSETVKIVPRDKFLDVRRSLPDQTIPRIPEGDHLQEFFNAIHESRPAISDFSYAGPFTETVLLGVIAERTGRDLTFDGEAGKFINDEAANTLLSKKYPDGWILG